MRYLPLVGGALPAETDMLRGIASGSQNDFEDIMVLNTRYEILHYPKNECTTYAALRTATKDQKTFIGQNWDQRPMVAEHTVVLHLTMGDGTKIMGLTEAGQMLRNGFNSHGLGLVSSGLNSSTDTKDIGIPGNFMRMRVLRSSSFDEMSDLITTCERSVANNYCIASSKDDKALDIEAIPGTPFLFHPEKGVIAHANHILGDPSLDTSKGKKFRGERLGELLRGYAPDITAGNIKESLSDHEGFPDSVCNHCRDEVTDQHRQWMTVASMIYNLDDLEFEVCCGNPCEGEYVKYRLGDY
jgi:isopenicillin-N N-acyltransferase-like protein